MPWFLIQVRTMKKLSEIIWWKISSSFLHKTDAFYMYMNCHVCHMKVLFSILKICYHQNRNYCYNHGHNLWNFLILYQIFFSPVKRSLIISNNHGIYELPHELRYFTGKLEFVSYILSMIVYGNSFLLLTHPSPLKLNFLDNFGNYGTFYTVST